MSAGSASAPAGRDGERFSQRLALHAGLRYLALDPAPDGPEPVDTEAARLVQPWLARELHAIPVGFEDEALLVAVADPADEEALRTLRTVTGRAVVPVIASAGAIARAQERIYGPRAVDLGLAGLAPRRRDPRYYEEVARRFGLPFVSLDPPSRRARDPVNPGVAQTFSEAVCRRLLILPVSLHDGELTLATAAAPGQLELALAVAETLTGRRPRVVVTTPDSLERAIDRAFAPPPYVAPAEPAAPAAPEEGDRRRLGELLVATGLITRVQLLEGLRIQERVGGRLGEVLVHAGLVPEDQVVAALAEQLRLPVVDLSKVRPEPDALALVPEPVARRHRFVPLAISDHVLYLAMSDPLDDDAVAELRAHTRLPIRIVIASRPGVELLLQRTYATRYVRVATTELLNRSPDESAYRVLTWPQRAGFLAVLIVFGLFLLYSPVNTIIAFNVFSVLFYTSFSLYKFRMIYDALGHAFELPVTEEEVAALDERELPIYTIMVPLYREAAVLPKLVESLSHLDYPPSKLDVKLILEEDDLETQAAIRELHLPAHFKIVIVPDAQPKTKPKACNYALIQAEGKYVVIYDAEDRPDSDQLKKIVVAYSKAEERIVCIQCKLNYYNRDQNILTRWFTIEYSSWFDLFMPGLDAADSPIPLGGTSNHLVRDKLIEVGAWDPFNVTEDADLGVRLHKFGYKTAIVDSTTYEEANSDLYNWIRQRSRWVKGYIQTWLVHMRHPVKLWRQMGWRSWWSFQFVIAGTFVGFLLNPFYWVLTTLWLATQAGFIRELFPSFVYFAAAAGLYLGNFVFTYINVAGVLRRGYPELVKYALLSPLYWALMSVGAYKGLFQLFYRPFYWEKTVHGLDRPAESER
jgi:cellulose synthase/poly-beta-1,6-N-acetylglucosamine synthase-like glycosyltransferase